MNREQAKELIRDTFESPFNKKKFIEFIQNLLNLKRDEIENTAKGPWQGVFIPHAFKDHISKYERIAKYFSNNDRIDILIVHLKRSTSIERARTMQRNFVAGYLNGDYGSDTTKNAALVAFVSPDSEDWRFSLVKIDYIFDENGKVIVEESPARRWSFLVGKNEKSHTAQSRLIQILEDDEHNPTLKQLEEAFNIEPVTKEFFDKYRNLLVRTVEALDKIVKENTKIRNDFKSKNINTVDFAKKLLGQIVFLYFLQKKGWFGVERDADWGTGPKDFLRRLFNKEYGDYKNFFNDILEPLFYEALAQKRNDDFYSRFNCKIPFLNGGLFEPIGGYDWKNIKIFLPDGLFSNRCKTAEGDIGDGILDVFDRFNFTVKEDEPLEKEVAIDPELLGKLYEKFNAIRPDNFYEYKKALTSGKKNLEKQFNKKFGVYYTPREIVHYMCQQSLIYFLSAELEGKVSKEDVEKFVKFGEQFIENDATALIKEQRIKEGKQKTSDYELKLPENIRKNAKLIDNKLKNIKICDPAVGSGAFLVGMMHEIVKIRHVLSVHINESDKSIYNFKRECIENSLYAVDIDSGACEVAKLRLWLSLIVDEKDIKEIKPLPNLDYKIVQGNSLLGFPENWHSSIVKKIEKLKRDFFSETNPMRKKELKNEIDKNIKWRFENSERYFGYKIDFDFRMFFSEVFHEKGGFDVVIANPPYGINIKDINVILNNYNYFDRQKNSASFFIEFGTKITNNKGIITYIVPKSLSFSEGWQKTRMLIVNHYTLQFIIDVSKVFKNVLLEQIIICFTKEQFNSNYSFYIGDGWERGIKIRGKIKKTLVQELDILPNYVDTKKLDILKKIQSQSVLLSTISKTFRGLPYQRRVSNNGMPILRGKNIGKYTIYGKLDKINLSPEDLDRKKVKEILRPKMVSQNIVAHVLNPFDQIIIMATIDKKGILTLDTVMNTYLTTNDYFLEYILAIINSKLASWFYYWFVYNRAIRTMHFDKYYTGKMPIKIITKDKQKTFVKLVQKILSITQYEDYLENPQKQAKVKEYEQDIDRLVYRLYKLTNEEIKIVEGNLVK